MDDRFLRKANPAPFLDSDDDTPLLRLLRDLFIERAAPYCVKELAADLGVSVFSVYKMFAGDRPLRAETLLHIIGFVAFKDAKDSRLVDLIVGHAGFVAMPKAAGENIQTLRQIYELAQEITKREG